MPKQWKNEPFEADATRAYTLDASWYLDPAVYDLEIERIFSRTWQPVAKLKDLSKPGDYVATEVVGEPILVLRDSENCIRGYYNVCPHRAGALARGCGNRKSIQCTYHGWTFDLDGKLMNTPYFFEVENFNPGDFNLREVRADVWGPYVFVNLDDDTPPLKDWWGDEFDRAMGIDFSQWHLVDEREYEINVNWKVYMDNYAETYHAFIAHPGLIREMHMDDLYVDLYRFHSTQRAEIKPPYVGNPYQRRYVNPKPGDSIRYHVMFPNFMIDDYPDNISTNIVVPIAPDKMILKFDWWFRDDATQEMKDSMIVFADQVQQEDIQLCDDVQRNLRSRAYNVGRFSGRYEGGVHQFHALVHAFVNNPDTLPGFSVGTTNGAHP